LFVLQTGTIHVRSSPSGLDVTLHVTSTIRRDPNGGISSKKSTTWTEGTNPVEESWKFLQNAKQLNITADNNHITSHITGETTTALPT